MRTHKTLNLAAAALFTVACGISSPAWCKPMQSLWVANEGGDTAIELSPSDLTTSGSPTAKVVEGIPLDFAGGVAFDHFDNLWVTTFANKVLQFTPGQLRNLGAVPNPTPNATIESSAFAGIAGCTFDQHGNLWIVDETLGGVHELTEAQLTAGSNAAITPAISITSSSLSEPNFDLFDGHGNLWISSEDSYQLEEFAAAELGSSGSKTPKVIISGGGLSAPGEMGLDSKGNLWVANYIDGTVVMFSKKQLKVSGSPMPKVTLTSGDFDGPWGLTFDNANNLWVSNYNGNTILEFNRKQLKKSASVTPPVVLTGEVIESYEMVFGPVY